jgi:hypothetical protein
MWFTWYFRSSQPRWFFEPRTNLADVVEALLAVKDANGIDGGASN